jgi:HNH endonuclease
MPRNKLWPVIRLRKLTNERWRCQACPETLIKRREVHHVKSVQSFRALELSEENLVALCPDCHACLHKIISNRFLMMLITLYHDRRFLTDHPGYRLDFGPVPHQFDLPLNATAANEDSASAAGRICSIDGMTWWK